MIILSTRHFTLHVCLLISFLFSSWVLARPHVDTVRVDQILQKAYDEYEIPGLAAAVIENGRLSHTRFLGVRDLGAGNDPNSGEKITFQTRFGLASVSKSFTAFGIFVLVDDGKLSLEAPIGRILHDLPDHWRSITVHQLLTHTSGLPQFAGPPTWQEALQKGASEPMLFPPGTQQSYNNGNFCLLGKVIEAVASQPYLEFMAERVFMPLKLNSTGGHRTHMQGNFAVGYYLDPSGERKSGALFPRGYGIPSGGLVSNLEDLVRWNIALDQKKILSPESYKTMWTSVTPPGDRHPWHFTPGWQSRKTEKAEITAKNGMIRGYASMIQRINQEQTSIIILANLSGPDHFWKEAAQIWQEAVTYNEISLLFDRTTRGNLTFLSGWHK